MYPSQFYKIADELANDSTVDYFNKQYKENRRKKIEKAFSNMPYSVKKGDFNCLVSEVGTEAGIYLDNKDKEYLRSLRRSY